MNNLYRSFLFLCFFSFISLCVCANQGNYKVYDYESTSIPKTEAGTILFIIDFSNSMNDYLGGRTKIDIAINTLAKIARQVNPQTRTGLRIYGHKFGFNRLLGCRASELVAPILPNNTNKFYSYLTGTPAIGWTPITYSLKKAVENDFAGIDGLKRIILLTDGGETCDESPCDYALKLVQERSDIQIDVIAFALDDEEALNQLKCTALATYGKIYTANDAQSLSNSLQSAIAAKKEVQATIIEK